MLSSFNTRGHPRTELKADLASNRAPNIADSVRLHWPEYLMEAGGAGLYLFYGCTVATLLWHPVSPVQRYLPSDAVRRMLMGLAMGATVMAIVLSPWGKQSGAHFAELAISFILMSAILFASNHQVLARYTHYLAAVLIAVYIAFESPLSGMSTNPARTFGPALYGMYWHGLLIYFTAPPIGMLAAAEVFLLAREGKGPYCAMLHHHNDKRCIFRHSGPNLTAPAS